MMDQGLEEACLIICPIFPLSAQPADPVVYITEYGKKYHSASCAFLEKSRIPIPLSEAGGTGYTPCSRCDPPPLPSECVKNKSASPSSLYRVNTDDLESYRDADTSRMIRAVVVHHVDGDTVHVSMPNPPAGLNSYEKLRMIGVDTPETRHPLKQVQYFGREASAFTKSRLLYRAIYLAFDWFLRDRYNRLMAYIYLQDGSCHNADLIREGYAHTYTWVPFKFLEEFRDLERYARENKRGLWK